MQKTQTELAVWVDQAKNGDKRALEELYRQTNKQMYYFALKMLGHEQDAYDVLQDSYLRAFTSLRQLEHADGFLPWLHTIVRNRTKDCLSKRGRLVPVEEMPDIEDTDENFIPQEYVSTQAKRKLILDMIKRLPDVQRETILLFYYEEMTIPEIARYMDCPESTVKSRLNYARRFIKGEVETLEEQGTKLYSAVGLSVLTRILHTDLLEYQIPVEVEKAVFDAVLEQMALAGAAGSAAVAAGAASAAAGSASSAAVTLGAKIAAWPLVAKLVALVGAVAVGATLTAGGAALTTLLTQGEPVNATVQEEPETTAAAVDNSVWIKAYLELLENEFQPNRRTNDVELLDVTGDGMPELLYFLDVGTDDGWDLTIPYTCQNGVAVPMMQERISNFTFSRNPDTFEAIAKSEKMGDGVRYESFKIYAATAEDMMQWKNTFDFNLYRDAHWANSYVETEEGRKFFVDQAGVERVTWLLGSGSGNGQGEVCNWSIRYPELEVSLTGLQDWDSAKQILVEEFENYVSTDNLPTERKELILKQFPSQSITEFFLENLPPMQDMPMVDNAIWSNAFLELMEDTFYPDSMYNELHLIDVTGDGMPELLYFPGTPGSYGVSYVPYTYLNGKAVPLTTNGFKNIVVNDFVYRSDTGTYEGLYRFPHAANFGVTVYTPQEPGSLEWPESVDVMLYPNPSWMDSYVMSGSSFQTFSNEKEVTAEIDRLWDTTNALTNSTVPFEMTVDLTPAADWPAAKRLLEEAFASYRPGPRPEGNSTGSKALVELVNQSIEDSAALTPSSQGDWARAYADFLSANCVYKDFGTQYNLGKDFWWGMQIDGRDAVLTKVTVQDLNTDGIPELALEWGLYGSGGSSGTSFALQGDKVVQGGPLALANLGEEEISLPGREIKSFPLRDTMTGEHPEETMYEAIEWLEKQARS